MYIENFMIESSLEELNSYRPKSSEILPLDIFKIVDEAAVELGIEIPLMMEMAGYQLARLVYNLTLPQSVVVGVGPGNNGGGGLVAARKLKGWGLDVSLHLVSHTGNTHFHEQLERAIAIGVSTSPDWEADVFIDAYLGFSQYSPLDDKFRAAVNHANSLNCKKVSLDLPTGYENAVTSIQSDVIMTLAAAKTDLVSWMDRSEVYVADIGIPFHIYRMFGYKEPIPFYDKGLVKWVD
jgi:NAD(P)H-hydrate epimerase